MADTTADPDRKALLKSAYRKIQELRAQLDANQNSQLEPVAIIGMGCRFPRGANDLDSFWELLRDGVDGVTEIPAERWDVDEFYDPNPEAPGKMYVRRGGFIDNVRGFDPLFFHVSPLEAASMDPQQRVLLEVAWEALENAGLAADRLAGSATGVFLGVSGSDYAMMTVQGADEKNLQTHTATGLGHSIAAGHLSYFLGLRGPCVALDTACSSALTAIHLAAQSLRRGESRMALAGAINLILFALGNVIVCKAKMLSPDGKCKTFDASADGYVRSEGCGVLVLKLLSQAKADGDRILAVIRGTACNQDGRTNGLTAPSGPAQRDVIRAALEASALSPHDISYVETHGTGTSLGDPIEVEALAEVFSAGRQHDHRLMIGSVKSNVGHLEAAAGIASISKVILALEHGEIPPQLHCQTLNPHIPWNDLPFSIATKPTAWPEYAKRRIAGVSGFGYSGTNVHVIVEQAPPEFSADSPTERSCHILSLSAYSPEALQQVARRYHDYLVANPDAVLADVCFTANTGRSHLAQHLAVVAASNEELSAALAKFADDGLGSDNLKVGRNASQTVPVAFFVGDDLPAGRHRQLYDDSMVFRDAVSECESILKPALRKPLSDILWPGAPESAAVVTKDPILAAIASFVIGYGIARLWHSWGVVPSAIFSHGSGHSLAGVLAGVLTLKEGLNACLVRHRPLNGNGSHAHGDFLHSLPSSAQVIDELRPAPAELQLFSPVDGREIGSGQLLNASYWVQGSTARATHEQIAASLKQADYRVSLFINTTDAERRACSMDAKLHCSATFQDGSDDWATQLKALASFYVSGVSIDWQGFDRPWHRRRLALPTYPFQRQEYWMKTGSQRASFRLTRQSDTHPLLGRRIYSPHLAHDILFEATFDLESLRFLNDHRFFSTAVVPMAAYLEMASEASRQALGQGNHSIDDFVVEQPLLLAPGQVRIVQTILKPDGSDGYLFEILSIDQQEIQNPTGWKRHGGGTLRRDSSAATIAPRSGLLDEWRHSCDRQLNPDEFYSTVAERGVEYGATFRLIRRIEQGDGIAVALLRMPPNKKADVGFFGIHPGLLDSTIQALGLSQTRSNDHLASSGVYMPIGVEQFRLFKTSQQELWCRATIRPQANGNVSTFTGDVELIDPSGETVGELRGVRFKHASENLLRLELSQRQLAHWFFETRWEVLPSRPERGATSGKWLIFGEAGSSCNELLAVLEARGAEPILVQFGQEFASPKNGPFTICESRAEDYERLLDAVAGNHGELRGVVLLSGFGSSESTTAEASELARNSTLRLLQLVQALAKRGDDLAVLALVTHGAHTPNIANRQSIADGTYWGLGRVIAAELPSVHCRMIDLDPPLQTARAMELLVDHLCMDSAENQLLIRDAETCGLRLTRLTAASHERANSSAIQSGPVQMQIGQRGDFQQVAFVPQTLDPPGADEIQLRLSATGVNFRDILNVLGMYPGDAGPGGVECVGEIVSLGSNVTGWSVGDQVVAIPHRGYCTFANAPKEMVFRRPPQMSCEESATILVAYLTAAYALHNVAQMKRGDRVLIHAAAGGVGLAAVQCAQLAGAEIFVTAGSPAKREYLRHLGVQHIMDSRSLEFAEQIREITGGEGVDIVLNSLTGDAIPHGLSVLRPGGRFLEIGKNELWTTEQVARVNPTASYHVIDLLEPFRATPQVMRKLFDDLSERFAEGKLRPLPRRVFTLRETTQAFRYMAAARHIGKIVVVDPDAGDSFEFHASGTYLITGGLGGIGLVVARWMVSQGARRIVLVGRKSPTSEARTAIEELQKTGAEIIIAQADISRRTDVAALLSAHDSPQHPWRGIMHAAGVTDDGALVLQDKARFERVLAPKIDGAWNLHELTMHLPLDFFVLFSSGAGLFGNAGQGSYAAANAFMDTLALARQAAGLPALSINWGPWSDVGMAAAMDKRHAQSWQARGLSSIDPARGVRALQQLLELPGTAQAAVLPMDDDVWQRQFQGHQVPPLLASLVKAEVQPSVHRHSQQNVADRLQNAPPSQKQAVMIEVVNDILLEVFGFDSARTIPTDQNLAMLGMDSLLAIQFSNRLKTSFNCPIAPTLTFEYPTIEAIAGYLLSVCNTTDPQDAIPPHVAPPSATVETMTEIGQNFDPQQAQNILANLDRLSDQDVDALLNSFDMERETR